MKHRMKVRVIYGDTDKAGVVYYANYLRYFEMGRTELLRELGLTYRELEDKDGVILAVVEANLRYHASAHYDDLLVIETTLEKFDKISLTFKTLIFRKGEDKPLVEGTCRLAGVNSAGKLAKLPKKLTQVINDSLAPI